jgi:hypothetical protein
MVKTLKNFKMKLSQLKIGDKITHYCSGKLVEGTVIELKNGGVITSHEPVRWGRDTYEKTGIYEASELQKKWGGTDENGQPCKAKHQTTPAAFLNGNNIRIMKYILTIALLTTIVFSSHAKPRKAHKHSWFREAFLNGNTRKENRQNLAVTIVAAAFTIFMFKGQIPLTNINNKLSKQ